MHPTRGKLSDFTKIPEHLTSFSQVLSPLYWIGSIQISLPSLIPRQIGSLSVSPRRSSSIVVYASQRHPDAFATVQERGVGIDPRGKTQEVVSMIFSGSSETISDGPKKSSEVQGQSTVTSCRTLCIIARSRCAFHWCETPLQYIYINFPLSSIYYTASCVPDYTITQNHGIHLSLSRR